MKRTKISLISAAVALLAVSSCNLEKFPDTAINTENAMESVSDCQAFRNGLYSGMKYCFTGGFIYATDLQTDLYHAVANFGNFQGAFYSYSLTSSESTVATVWNGLYGYIGNANFLIDGIQKLLDRGTLDEADQALVRQYYGEACYIRAHMYFNLSQYFCEDYDPETAAETMGVPVVTRYAPTFDSSSYPSRGTLDQTYAQILADLSEAETYITTAGEPNAIYVTEDAVKALQARVALTMHDYQTAFDKASELVESGRYPLVTDAAAYAEGWVEDNLSESIWQVQMTGPDDTGNAYSYFIYDTGSGPNPQYVPEQWVLDLYDTANDIRYNAYFRETSFTSPVTGTLTLLVKYPGNPTLYTTQTNYQNKPKVFRISEMYLIAAEAAANITGQDAVASQYLNDLKRARIAGWVDQTYSGVNLMSEIRDERVRELYGEGFRLNDLKRWHMGFTRDAGQNPDLVMQGTNYASCTRPADDPYFVWPIPLSEMDANPQMVQNPAYTN